MSQLTTVVRTSRPAAAAVERARLALVPVRRVDAPRAPFAILVFLILGAGVVGLLMFNTQMQQDSFYATKLQQQADRLTAEQQSLQLELDTQRDPQHLAARASALGMVQSATPSFVDLATGRIVGVPTQATQADRVTINPRLTNQVPSFVPPPLYVEVPAKVPAKVRPAAKKGQKAAGDGPASGAQGSATGTNE